MTQPENEKIIRPDSLFGVPTGLGRAEAEDLVRFLRAAWESQYGSAPTFLSSDLRLLERYFNPNAQGRRLRQQIQSLQPIIATPLSLPGELYIPLGPDRGLVTPEGRVALAAIEDHLARGQAVIVIGIDELAWAYRLVAETYRAWSRARLTEAIQPKGLLPVPAIAFVLTLLINGSIGEARGLPIETERIPEREVNALIDPVVKAFVGELRPYRGRSEGFRLRGGWILTEATRKLYDSVRNANRRVWILEAAAPLLAVRLGQELRRHKGLTRSRVDAAMDSLAKAYRGVRPRLSSYGLAFEEPRRTSKVKHDFIQAFVGSDE